MEKYEITKQQYLKEKATMKKAGVKLLSGVWCHNCQNDTYKLVKRNGKYYYECNKCGVLDNKQ